MCVKCWHCDVPMGEQFITPPSARKRSQQFIIYDVATGIKHSFYCPLRAAAAIHPLRPRAILTLHCPKIGTYVRPY